MPGTRRLAGTKLHALERKPGADRSLTAQRPHLRLMLAVITRAMKDVTRPAIATQDTGGEFGSSLDALFWLLDTGTAWAAEVGIGLDNKDIFKWLAEGAEIKGNAKW